MSSVIEIIGRWLVGTRRTFRLAGQEVTLTLAAFEAPAGLLDLAVGRLDRVTVVGSDVRWSGGELTRAAVTGRDVQFRVDVLGRITVSTGRLEVEATVADWQVQAWLRRRPFHRLLTFGAGADAVLRVSVRGLSRLGHLELDCAALPDGIRLRSDAIVIGRWRVRVRRLLSLTIRPPLPAGLEVTAVEAGREAIKVGGRLPPREVVLTPPGLADLLDQVQNGPASIDLTGRLSWA